MARPVLQVHDGVVLRFYPTSSSESIHVRLGVTTAQDLICDLGPPLRTFYKEDDRMTIHSGQRNEDKGPEPSCAYEMIPSLFFRPIPLTLPLRFLQLLPIRHGLPYIGAYSCCAEDCAALEYRASWLTTPLHLSSLSLFLKPAHIDAVSSPAHPSSSGINDAPGR